MPEYLLQVADFALVPDDHPARATAEEHGGAWIVDCNPNEPEGVGSVDLTTNQAEARRFATEQEAFAFSRLTGLRAMPLVVARIDSDAKSEKGGPDG